MFTSFISTTIYRFDINLKDATTLGIVGAGGIGASLVQCLNSRRWAMVGAFVWGLMVLVLIIELVSPIVIPKPILLIIKQIIEALPTAATPALPQ